MRQRLHDLWQSIEGSPFYLNDKERAFACFASAAMLALLLFGACD